MSVDNCQTVATREGRLSFNGREYGPEFETQAGAADFIRWVGNRTGLDPRAQSDDRLAAMGEIWMED